MLRGCLILWRTREPHVGTNVRVHRVMRPLDVVVSVFDRQRRMHGVCGVARGSCIMVDWPFHTSVCTMCRAIICYADSKESAIDSHLCAVPQTNYMALCR